MSIRLSAVNGNFSSFDTHQLEPYQQVQPAAGRLVPGDGLDLPRPTPGTGGDVPQPVYNVYTLLAAIGGVIGGALLEDSLEPIIAPTKQLANNIATIVAGSVGLGPESPPAPANNGAQGSTGQSGGAGGAGGGG